MICFYLWNLIPIVLVLPHTHTASRRWTQGRHPTGVCQQTRSPQCHASIRGSGETKTPRNGKKCQKGKSLKTKCIHRLHLWRITTKGTLCRPDLFWDIVQNRLYYKICDPSRRNGHVGGMTPNWVIDTSLKSIS